MQDNNIKKKNKKNIKIITATAILGILIPGAIATGVGVAFAPYNKKLNINTTTPAIDILNTSNSQTKTLLVGDDSASFQVLASITNNNGSVLTYTWYSSSSMFNNGIKLLNTSNTLDVSNKLLKNVGTYYFYCLVKAVKNGNEVAYKQVNFTLNVIATPTITYAKSYTTNATLNENSAYYQTIEPNVSTNNSNATLTYQWYKSSKNNLTQISDFSANDLIKNATNNYYTLSANDVSSVGTTYYYLYTTGNISGNTFTSLSPAYSVVVSKAPSINITYNESTTSATQGYTGSTLTASVSTTNPALVLNYQWYTNNPVYKNDGTIKVNDTTYYLIPNANNSYYTLTTTDTTSIGDFIYGLSVSSTQNGVSITSSSNKQGIEVQVITTPTLTITNANNFKYTGTLNQANSINLTMQIKVQGGNSQTNSSIGFTYQWYKITDGNSSLLNGQINSVLTLTQNELNTAQSFYYAIVSYNVPNTNTVLTATTPTYSVILNASNTTTPTPSVITSTIYATNNETSYQTLITSINTQDNTNDVLSYQWYSDNPYYKNNTTTEINYGTYYIIPNANSTTYTLTANDVNIGNISSANYTYYLVQTATNKTTGQTFITNAPVSVIISAQAEVKWTLQKTDEANSISSIKTNLDTSNDSLAGLSTNNPIIINGTLNQTNALTTNLSAYIANADANFNNYNNSDIVYKWFKTSSNYETTGLSSIASSTNTSFNFQPYTTSTNTSYFVVYATYSINGLTSTSTPLYYELKTSPVPTLSITIPKTSYVVYKDQENTTINFNVNYTLNASSNQTYNTTGLSYTWYEITSNTTPTNFPTTNTLNSWTKMTNSSNSLSINTFSDVGTVYYYVIVSCSYDGISLSANNSNNLMSLKIVNPVSINSTLQDLSTLNSSNSALDITSNYSANVYENYNNPVVLGINNQVNNLMNNDNIVYNYTYTLTTKNISTNQTTTTTYTTSNSIYIYDDAFSLPAGSSYSFSVSYIANIYNANGNLIDSINNNISNVYTFNVINPDATTNQASINFSTTAINKWVGSTALTITPTINITGYNDANITYTWYKNGKILTSASYNPSYTFDFNAIGSSTYYVVMTINDNGYSKTITSNTLTINVIGYSKNASGNDTTPSSIKNMLPTISITSKNTIINAIQNETSYQTLTSSTTITNPANLDINISYNYTSSLTGFNNVSNSTGIYTLNTNDVSNATSYTITMNPVVSINGVTVANSDLGLSPIVYTINVSNTPTMTLSALSFAKNNSASNPLIIYQNQTLINTLSVLNSYSNVPSFLNSTDFGTSYVWTKNGVSLNNNNANYSISNSLNVGTYEFSVYATTNLYGVSVSSNVLTFYVKIETLSTNDDISGTISLPKNLTFPKSASSYALTASTNIINKTNQNYTLKYVWSSNISNSKINSYIDSLNETNNGNGSNVLDMTNTNDFFSTSAIYSVSLYAIINGASIKLSQASSNITITTSTDTQSLPTISVSAKDAIVSATLNETSYQTLSNTLSISNNSDAVPVTVSYTWTKKEGNTTTILSQESSVYTTNTNLNFAYTLNANDVSAVGSYEIILKVSYSIYGNSTTNTSTYNITVSAPTTIKPTTNTSSDSSSSNSSWTSSQNNSSNPINPSNPSSPYYKKDNVTYTTYSKTVSVYVGQTLNLPTLYASLPDDYAYSYDWLNSSYASLNDNSAIYQLTANDIKDLQANSSTTFTLNVTLNQNGVVSVSSFVFIIKVIGLPDVQVSALNTNLTAIQNQNNAIYLYTTNNLSNDNATINYEWTANDSSNTSYLTAYGSYAMIESSAFSNLGTQTYTVTPILWIDGASQTLSPITFTITIKSINDAITNNTSLTLNNQNIIYNQTQTASIYSTLTNQVSGEISSYTWYKLDTDTLNYNDGVVSNGTKITNADSSTLNIDPANYTNLGITSSGSYYYALVLTLNYNGSVFYVVSNVSTLTIKTPNDFISNVSINGLANTYNVFYNQTSNLPSLITNPTITFPTDYNMQVYYEYSTSSTTPTSNLTGSNVYNLTSQDIKDQNGPIVYYLYYQIAINGVYSQILKADTTYTINITKPSIQVSANSYNNIIYNNQQTNLFLSANITNLDNASLTYTWTYSINNASYKAIPSADIISNNGNNITISSTFFKDLSATSLKVQLVITADTLDGSAVSISYSNNASSLIYSFNVYNPMNAVSISYASNSYTVLQGSSVASITPIISNNGFFRKAGLKAVYENVNWYASNTNSFNVNDLASYSLVSSNSYALNVPTANLGSVYYFFVIAINLNGQTYYYTSSSGLEITTIKTPSASDFINYKGNTTNTLNGFVGQNDLWLNANSQDIEINNGTNYSTGNSNNVSVSYQWEQNGNVLSSNLNYLLPDNLTAGNYTYTLNANVSVNGASLGSVVLTTYNITITTPTLTITNNNTNITQIINTSNPSILAPSVTNNFNGLISYAWYESNELYTSLSDVLANATQTNITTPTYTLPIKTSTQTIYYYLVATAKTNNGISASNYTIYNVSYINNTISSSNALSISFDKDTYHAIVGQSNDLVITPTINGNFENYSNLKYAWTINSNTSALNLQDLIYNSTSANLTISNSAFSKAGNITLTLTLSGDYNNAPFSISKNTQITIQNINDIINSPTIQVSLNNTNTSSDPIYLLNNQNYYLTANTKITNQSNYDINVTYYWYKNGTLIDTTTTPYLEVNSAGSYSLSYAYTINGIQANSAYIAVSGSVVLTTYNTSNFKITTNQLNYVYYTYGDANNIQIENDLPTLSVSASGNSSVVSYAWYYGTSVSGQSISNTNSLNLSSLSSYLKTHSSVSIYVVATTTLNGQNVSSSLTYTLTAKNVTFAFSYLNNEADLNTNIASNLNIYTQLTSNADTSLIKNLTYTWNSSNNTINKNTSANFNGDVMFSYAGTYKVYTTATFTYLGMSISLTTNNFNIIVSNLDFSNDTISINGDSSYFLNQTNNTTITPLINIANNLNSSYTYTYQWILNNKVVSTSATYTINTNTISSSNNLSLKINVLNTNGATLTTLTSNSITYSVYNNSIFSASLTSNNANVLLNQTSNLPILTTTLNSNNNEGLVISDISYAWSIDDSSINNTTNTYQTIASDFTSTTAPTFKVIVSFKVNGVSTSLTISYTFTYSSLNLSANTLSVTSNSSVINQLYNQTNLWYEFSNQTSNFLTYTYTWTEQNLINLSNFNVSNLSYTFNIVANNKTYYSITQASNIFSLSKALNKLPQNTYSINATANISINGTTYKTDVLTDSFQVLNVNTTNIQVNLNSTSNTVYLGQTTNLPYLNATATLTINNVTINLLPTYQWALNYTDFTNSNSYYQTLTSNFTTTQNYVYSLTANYSFDGITISNNASTTITALQLTGADVSSGHYIINQSVQTTQYYASPVTIGVNATMSVNGVLSYTWYSSPDNYWQDTVPTSSTTGMTLMTNTLPTYTIDDFDTAGLSYYYCVTTLDVNGAVAKTYTKFTIEVNAVQTLSVTNKTSTNLTINDTNRSNSVLTTNTTLNYSGSNYDDLSSDVQGVWVLLTNKNDVITTSNINNNISNGQSFSVSLNNTTYTSYSNLLSSSYVLGQGSSLLLPASIANIPGTYYLQYLATIQNVNNSGLSLYGISSIYTITVQTPTISNNLQAQITNATYNNSYNLLKISNQNNSWTNLPTLSAEVLDDGNSISVSSYKWQLEINGTIISINNSSSTLNLNNISNNLTASCNILCTMQVSINGTILYLMSSYRINIINISASSTLKYYNPINDSINTSNSLSAYQNQTYSLPTLTPDITYSTNLPGTLSYTWYRNNDAIATSNNASTNNLNYTLNSYDTSNGTSATYYLIITDTYNGITYKVLQTDSYTITFNTLPSYSVINDTSNATSGANSSNNSYILSIGQSNLPVLGSSVSLNGDSSSIDGLANTITSYTWFVTNSLTSNTTTYTTSTPFFPLSKIINDMGIYSIYLEVQGSLYGASITGNSSSLPFNVLINQTPTFKLTTAQNQLVDINSVYTISATITFKGLSFPNTTAGQKALKQWENSMNYTYTIQRYTLNQGLEISAYSDLFSWNTINTGKVSFSASGNDMVGTITYSNVAFETSIPTRQFQIQVQQAGTNNTFDSPVTTITSNFTANTTSSTITDDTAEQNLEDLLANPDYDMGIIWQYATSYSTSTDSLTNELFNRSNGYVVFGYPSFTDTWDLKLDSISYIQSGGTVTIPNLGTSQPVPFDTFVLTFTNQKQVQFNSTHWNSTYVVHVGATVEYALPVPMLQDSVSFTSIHDSGINSITRQLQINSTSGSGESKLTWPSNATGNNNFSNLFFTIYNNGNEGQFGSTLDSTTKYTYPTNGWQLPNTSDIGFNSSNTVITTNDVSWSWIPIYYYTTNN